MCTLSCRNTHIQAIQCLHGQLGGTLATALATGRGDIACLTKRVNIIRAYLRILYCHWAPTIEIKYLWKIEISQVVGNFELIMTTDAGTTSYDTNVYRPADVAGAIISVFNVFDAVANVDGEIIDDVIYLWSDDPIFSFTSDTPTSASVTELTTSTEDFLSKKNHLTNTEIENIITSAYKVLES